MVNGVICGDGIWKNNLLISEQQKDSFAWTNYILDSNVLRQMRGRQQVVAVFIFAGWSRVGP